MDAGGVEGSRAGREQLTCDLGPCPLDVGSGGERGVAGQPKAIYQQHFSYQQRG